MPQPPSYNREKDFTEDFGNETDHSALNAELDRASNSINDIRTNLAILQADDGKLNPNVITADSISEEVRAELSAGIVQSVQGSVQEAADSAAAAAESAENLATAVSQANASKNAAAQSASESLTNKQATDARATEALASRNAAAASELNVTTLAWQVATAKLATDGNATATAADRLAVANYTTTATQAALEADADRIAAQTARTQSQGFAQDAEQAKTAAEQAAATVDPNKIVYKTSSTGSARVPAGTTLERDSAPEVGDIRYNKSVSRYEGYGLSGWAGLGAQITSEVVRSSDLTIAAATPAKQTWPVVVRDPAMMWDAATNEFVVKWAGWHEVSAACSYIASPTGVRSVYLHALVNGSLTKGKSGTGGAQGADTFSLTVNAKLYLDVGDRVGIFAYIAGGSLTQLGFGDADHNFFQFTYTGER